jgi:hypothetical protein
LEEYKPFKMNIQQKNTISDLLRSGYDRHVDRRGNKDQSVKNYTCRSPMILVGEATPDEVALQDRAINCHFTKKSHNEFSTNSFLLLKKNKKLLTKLGRSLLDEVIRISEDDIENMFNKFSVLTNDFEINSRKQEHITKLLICYKILERFYNKLGLNLTDILTFNEVVNTLKESQEEIETFSIIEETLELFDRISNQFQPEWHYKICDGAIHIDFKQLYDVIRKYHKDYNLETELLNYKEFTKQLKTSKYFIKYTSVRLRVAYQSIADSEEKENSIRVKKCFTLDIKKLKENGLFNILLG